MLRNFKAFAAPRLRTTAPVIVALAFLASAGLSARTWYVVSPAARLHVEPSLSAAGDALPRGAAVETLSEQGLFFRVRFGERNGYVSRLFVSLYPPTQRSVATPVADAPVAGSRRRASDVAETAGARGMEQSRTNLRVRGAVSEYDFDAVLWIENQPVDAARVRALLGP